MQRSEQINDLAAALVAARKKFKPVKKAHTANVQSTKGSYKYTYSTLDDLYDATDDALGEHGLVTMHNIESGRDGVGVSTMLLHQSGQFIQTDPVWLPGGSTPQSVGSAVTYARRYSLQAALGIAAEEDDDGLKVTAKPARTASAPAPAEKAQEPRATAAPAPPRATTGDDRVISEPQRKRFYAVSQNKGWTAEDVKKLLASKGYTSSKDIRVRDYDLLIKVMETGEYMGDDGPGGDDIPFPAPWEGGVQ